MDFMLLSDETIDVAHSHAVRVEGDKPRKASSCYCTNVSREKGRWAVEAAGIRQGGAAETPRLACRGPMSNGSGIKGGWSGHHGSGIRLSLYLACPSQRIFSIFRDTHCLFTQHPVPHFLEQSPQVSSHCLKPEIISDPAKAELCRCPTRSPLK